MIGISILFGAKKTHVFLHQIQKISNVLSSLQLNFHAEGFVTGFPSKKGQMFYRSFCVKKGFSKNCHCTGSLQEQLVFVCSYFSNPEEVWFFCWGIFGKFLAQAKLTNFPCCVHARGGRESLLFFLRLAALSMVLLRRFKFCLEWARKALDKGSISFLPLYIFGF